MAEKLESRHSLPIANKSPQPDFQSHDKLVRIRSYRPSDSEQVRELFVTGLIHGLVKAIYKAQWKGPTACVSYCSLGLGILLATFPTSPRMRFIGIALCISGCALLVVLRYIFSYMMSDVTKQALNGDFKDIGKTFGMDPVDNGEKTEEYAPSGSSGFCVAEAYQKGSEINKSRTKIVGFVGIVTNSSNPDKTDAELRRMVVSADYRRRGVAVSLIRTTLRHAHDHGITSVVLSTTIFQSAAIAMYEKFGWVLQRKFTIRLLLDTLLILYYSLDLATVKI